MEQRSTLRGRGETRRSASEIHNVARAYRVVREGRRCVGGSKVGVRSEMRSTLFLELGIEPVCAKLESISRTRASYITIEIIEQSSVARW